MKKKNKLKYSVVQISIWSIVLLYGLFVVSCTKQQKQPSIKELVDRGYKGVKTNEAIYLFNKRRAAYYDSLSKTNSPNKLLYKGKKAYELLNAGETKESILTLKELLEELDQNTKYKQYIPGIKQILALAYMRLGEQENCIINHTNRSCIIPIEEEGIHSLEQGSSKAIEIYKELLLQNPKDYSSKWLINIAYMTLGRYPDEVPSQWLVPEAAFQSEGDMTRFEDVASSLDVDVMGLAGGVSIEDFNNDGFLDIVTSSWGIDGKLHYFQSNGDGRFSNKTEQAGLSNIHGGLNIIHADYDNDGYVDVLVLRGAWFQSSKLPNSLLKNNGDGTFTDVTIKAGVLSFSSTQTASWSDINNDGWLDLFIGNESSIKYPVNCEMYLNNTDGTFTNVTKATGLAGGRLLGWVKGCTFGDINNDGWNDLYVSFYNKKNKLFINKGAVGKQPPKFEDISKTAGVQEPVKSFPTWFWDYDNDGLLDIFVSGYEVGTGLNSPSIVLANYMGVKKNGNPRIYRNKGDNTFEEVSKELGLSDAIFTMGCNYGDLDNDGYQDFYLGTGDPDLMSIYPNRMFKNDNGQKFLDVTTAGGFGHIQKGHAIGFGDLDNDGDQDIYAVMGGAQEGDVFQNALFENPIGNKNNWITIKLVGSESNKSAIGARVTIQTKSKEGTLKSYHRTVSTGGSFGASSLQLEVGLKDAILITKIEVVWPNLEQTKSVFVDIPINQKIEIVEGEKRWKRLNFKAFSFRSEKNKMHDHQY